MLRKDDAYSLDWRALLIVLAPIAVFIASDLAFRSFGVSGIHLSVAITPPPIPDPHAARVGEDGAARMYIVAALITFAAVAIGVVLVFANDFARTYGPKIRFQLIVGMAGGVLIAFMYTRFPGQLDAPQKYLGTAFVELAGDWARTEGCASDAVPGPGCYFRRLEQVILWSLKVTPLIIAILIAGAGSCLARLKDVSGEDARRVAIERQQRRLQGYVTCAAALLATGLLLALAWTSWPLSVLEPSELVGYKAYVNALMMFFGVTYSAMLASYAIPIAVMLQMRGAAVSSAPDETGQRHSPLETGLIDALRKIFMVLVPALIGALPIVLDLFK